MKINITGGIINAVGGTSYLLTNNNNTVIAKIGAAGIGGGVYADSGQININSGVPVNAVVGETDISNIPPNHPIYSGLTSVQTQSAQAIGCGFGGDTANNNVNLNANLPRPAASVIPDKPMVTYHEDVQVIVGYDEEEIETESVNVKTLKDISTFYDPSGKFLIAQPQALTITQGNGQKVNITLYEHDTMEDVAKKINDAIADGLGQARYTDNKNKFCTISDGTENSSESIFEEDFAGHVSKIEPTEIESDGEIFSGSIETDTDSYNLNATMLIRSAIPGKAGELYFSGDEDLLNALGLNTIQESQEAEFIASVYDAHSGVAVATNVKSSAPEFKSLIPPAIDIEVDAMAGLKANWDESTKRFITTRKENYSAFLHLKDNGTVFQIGANEGEDFLIQLGDSSSQALGISSVNVLTRETASRAISLIDSAINKNSTQRAKIGAYQNALEHTMENLTVTSLNLTAAESRIRDADMSTTMMDFVKLQILNQSGTSMLAQANQLPQSVLNLL